jgi:hypothetical protein
LSAGLVFIAFLGRDALIPALSGWGIWLGLGLTAVVAYVPVRTLHSLSDAAPSWWWDTFYYSTVALFIGGVVLEDSNVIVAGIAPTFFMNGIIGVLALVIERRHNVRVHISGRRYLFLRDGTQ